VATVIARRALTREGFSGPIAVGALVVSAVCAGTRALHPERHQPVTEVTMPVFIGFLVVSLLAGLLAPRTIAYGITAAAGAFTVFVFVWAVADGKGDDPVWLIALALGAVAIGFAVVEAAARGRSRVAAH